MTRPSASSSSTTWRSSTRSGRGRCSPPGAVLARRRLEVTTFSSTARRSPRPRASGWCPRLGGRCRTPRHRGAPRRPGDPSAAEGRGPPRPGAGVGRGRRDHHERLHRVARLRRRRPPRRSPATTHWASLDTWPSSTRRSRCRPDDRYVDDGDVVTSAASAPASTWPSTSSAASSRRRAPPSGVASSTTLRLPTDPPPPVLLTERRGAGESSWEERARPASPGSAELVAGRATSRQENGQGRAWARAWWGW